jgi:hypothetical protein
VKSRVGIHFCWVIMVGMILCWHNDWFGCASRYLYFSSEIGVLLVALAVYNATFAGMKWSAPPETGDRIPVPGWRLFTRKLIYWLAGLTLIMLLVWLAAGIRGELPPAQWFKRGIWAGYMLVVYSISIVLVFRYIAYVNHFALAVTATIMVYLLSTYEIILLDRGMGWEYNNTVIGYLFGIPLDNILFVYPVSPVLAILFYSVLSRDRNDLRAFWLINALLAPASVIFELLAVYPLDIWRVFTGQSVWPMGKTCIEEFIFYFLMQFLSIVLYAFFKKQTKGPAGTRPVKEPT